jgi:hypothetical protein
MALDGLSRLTAADYGWLMGWKDSLKESLDMGEPYAGQKWDYRVVMVSDSLSKGLMGGGALEGALKQAGEHGWELVQIVNDRAVFKRPVD